MDDHEIIDALRQAGTEPVPTEVQTAHLARMASATPRSGPKRFGRLAVAAAAVVGFVVGSTGFAMAGALPDPAQDVAHDVLGAVRIDVPAGKEGKRGPCVSEVAKRDIPPEEKETAKAECPKGPFGPATGAEGTDGAPRSKPGPAKHADDPCRGRPPWAGQPDLPESEEDRLEAEREAQCGADADDAGEPPDEGS